MSFISNKENLQGVRNTSTATLCSRVLGMLRDIATASLLGLSSGGVMDAFSFAFRIPDFFRRLFGEGSLTASFIPAFTEIYREDKTRAWRLVSDVISLLIGIMLISFATIILIFYFLGGSFSDHDQLVFSLLAMMLPFCGLISVTAYLSATLQSFKRFLLPAMMPVVLNLIWLSAACGIAPYITEDPQDRAKIIACSITLAGMIQIVLQFPVLRKLGFSLRIRLFAAWSNPDLRKIFCGSIFTMLSLTITQMSTFSDCVIAYFYSLPVEQTNEAAAILKPGATSLVYLAERFYQFPLGVIGIAIASVIYPQLSQDAAEKDHLQLGKNLTSGINLAVSLGLPASMGIVLLSQPLAHLFFQYGEFTDQDAVRTGEMIAAYAIGVAAFCTLPTMVRGFLAMKDFITPVLIGGFIVLLNIILDLIGIQHYGETALGMTTALTAFIHLILLLFIFAKRYRILNWSSLLGTIIKSMIATLVMSVMVFYTRDAFSGSDKLSLGLKIMTSTLAGIFAYYILARLLKLTEPIHLLHSRSK